MNKRQEGKPVPKIWQLAILVIGLVIWVAVLMWSPTQAVKVPSGSLPTYRHSTQQAVTSPLPSTGVQSPTQKVTTKKPTSQSITIYYSATGISKMWGLQEVVNTWSKAKYEDLKLVDRCPVADDKCVTIRLDPKIDPTDAAITDFYTDHIVIRLNPAIHSAFESQSALCHEVGHTLGLPHIIGSINSCMPAIGDYRTTPSQLDLRLLDSLGHWTLESAYKSTLKDIDVRKLPQ